jgi:hypothetical protein
MGLATLQIHPHAPGIGSQPDTSFLTPARLTFTAMTTGDTTPEIPECSIAIAYRKTFMTSWMCTT